MSTITEKEVNTSFLKNEKVLVQFIPKPTKEITDPRHVAYGGKLEGTYDYITPPRLRKDKLKNILTDEEKEGLEYLMNVDLSIYKDFWKSYGKESLFPIALGKENKILDLSIPEDYIVYKVLLNNDLIASSPDDIKNKPRATYKYVLVKEAETDKAEEDYINDKSLAYKFYNNISDNATGLRYVLSQLGKHTHKGQKLSFLRKEVGKAIDNPKELHVILALSKEKYFDVKVLIQNAFEMNIIDRISGQYFTKENEPIAGTGEESTIDNAAKFLSSPVGQEMRLGIEARIKNAKED